MTHNFEFFYESKSPYSNWYQPNSFTHYGVTYNCSEQYMMHIKAIMFNDTEVADLIMEQTDPRKQKMLGREVRGFNEKEWLEECNEIMIEGLFSKFTQNPDILKQLLATGEKILVEASPIDKVWGIGLSKDDPRALDQSTWRGQNRLGFVLVETRKRIRAI